MISWIARLALFGALAAGLSGCADKPKPKMDAKLIQPDCYTVDPYHPIKIHKAAKGVPDNMKKFLGAWGGGAWNGTVCHDLWITEVDPDGETVMFDAHGPGFTREATAFTRKGVITSDGHLKVRKGPAEVEYWIKDGRMYGERREGNLVYHIIMTRHS